MKHKYHYFDDIYQAALGFNKAKMQSIANKCCINEFKVGELFLTPADLLALNGEIEAAKWLLYNYGADPEFVAYGAALGKQKAFVEALKVEFSVKPFMIAMGASRAGDKKWQH